MSQTERPQSPRPPGRLRAAWSVLRGQRLVPAQIQAEWLEYQLIFDDLLTRLSVSLARQAKAERKRLRRLVEEAPADPSPPPQQSLALSSHQSSPKSALRSLAADRMGLGGLRSRLPSSSPQERPPLPSHPPEEVAL